MVPDKRTITAACGLMAAAALALAACAPSGYGGDDGGDPPAAPALANATGTPEPTASSEAPADNSNSGTNSNVKLTEELKASTIKKMGKVVVDQGGWVLYRFDKDKADPPKSTCNGDCAKVWPPSITDGNPSIEGISTDLVGTVTRDDGTKQLTVNGWPVYRYIGDKTPGKWTGQGVAGTWWVIDPTGKKNLTCVPTATPTAAKPPADDTADKDDSSSSSGSSSTDGGYSY